MSTILKALKQAEKESRKHSSPPSFDTGVKETLLAPEGTKQFIPRPVLFLAIVLVIAGIAFAYVYPRLTKMSEPPAPAPAPAARQQAAPVKASQPAIDKPSPPKPAAQPVKHVQRTEKKKAAPEPAPPEPAPAVPQKTKMPKVPPAPKPAQVPAPAAAPKPGILTPSAIPLMTDRGLKIQAISWDTAPSNRVTVINNSILNEGDIIKGLRIVRIEKDSVILNDNGKDYRLKFGYR